VAWPERILSARVMVTTRQVGIQTAHIPPGVSNGWIKAETLEGIYKRLKRRSTVPRVRCGDFNTPQEEGADGIIVTWAHRRRPDGCWVLRPRRGLRWDAAERNFLQRLAAFDLPDVFQAIHGYGVRGFSWITKKGQNRVRRRCDHVFASRRLKPIAIAYLDRPRRKGLSDHAPVEVDFAWSFE